MLRAEGKLTGAQTAKEAASIETSVVVRRPAVSGFHSWSAVTCPPYFGVFFSLSHIFGSQSSENVSY